MTDTATHGVQPLQFRYPLAGVGEILVDECSFRQPAECILQSEGIHAMVLWTGCRTQRARLGPHTETILPKKRSASGQHTR